VIRQDKATGRKGQEEEDLTGLDENKEVTHMSNTIAGGVPKECIRST
jgi:hypothetical protein